MGMEKRDHIRAVATTDEVSQRWRKVHGRNVLKGDIDAMYEAFTSLLLASIEAQSDLIPGILPSIDTLRTQGIMIGGSTGYFSQAAEIVVHKAAALGYVPDFTVNSSEVPAGRPEPWMIFRVMEALRVWPPKAVVNIGDTPVDIESGINAGVWSIGVAATGNQMGLTQAELGRISPEEYVSRLGRSRTSLHNAGAHYVIDTMEELPTLIENINIRLAAGDRP